MFIAQPPPGRLLMHAQVRNVDAYHHPSRLTSYEYIFWLFSSDAAFGGIKKKRQKKDLLREMEGNYCYNYQASDKQRVLHITHARGTSIHHTVLVASSGRASLTP